MKLILISKRSKALLGILIVAISFGIISKKVISYPTEDCMRVFKS